MTLHHSDMINELLQDGMPSGPIAVEVRVETLEKVISWGSGHAGKTSRRIKIV